MENASKALLMAGGVLIAMMIMAMGIYLFTQYSQMGSQYNTKMSAQETASFNSNFTVFEKRENITAQEIASLVNFVKDYKGKTDLKVRVFVNGTDFVEKNEDLTEFVKDNSTEGSDNSVKVKYYKFRSITYNGPFDTVDSIGFINN